MRLHRFVTYNPGYQGSGGWVDVEGDPVLVDLDRVVAIKGHPLEEEAEYELSLLPPATIVFDAGAEVTVTASVHHVQTVWEFRP